MTIVVTGGTGLLGSDLCRRLAGDHSVESWSRATVDIADGPRVLRRIEELKPQAVVHCAAMSDVDACERDPESARRINRDGTAAVARACSAAGAFLVAVSTDYVFDGALSRPYREEDEPNPLSVYARSKREGEEAALRLSPRCLVVRVSGLFGRARANFVTGSVERFRAGRPVPVVTDQAYSPSYTQDLAEGIQLLLDWKPQGILHLVNAGGTTRLEVAERIASLLGADPALIERTTWSALNRPARRPVNSRLDCSRFARLAGRSLRPWDQALEAFLPMVQF